MENERILVVDDEPDLRLFVVTLLEDAGYVVRSATNGLDAMEQLNASVPDALLLDLAMPMRGGLAVLKTVRADPRLRALPVLILSGNDDGEKVVKGLELGADQYLTKPFSTWELLARLSSMLRMIEFRRRLTLERAGQQSPRDTAGV